MEEEHERRKEVFVIRYSLFVRVRGGEGKDANLISKTRSMA